MPTNQNGNYSNRYSAEDRQRWQANEQFDERDHENDRDRERDRYRQDLQGERGRFSETERYGYGQGQSGYAAGRYADDPSMQFENRNLSGDREPRGLDDRWSGRGGEAYYGDRGYARGDHGWNPGVDSRERSFDRDRDERGGGQRGGQQGMPGTGRQFMYGRNEQASSTRETSHAGKGPRGYQMSDERLKERVCEALSDDHDVDASDIDVAVKNGEVTLTGVIDDRRAKRLAEECVEGVRGVRDVHNQLRLRANSGPSTQPSSEGTIDPKKARA